jgi:hypothetical protein
VAVCIHVEPVRAAAAAAAAAATAAQAVLIFVTRANIRYRD